jgi:choline dehydrogenase-like flavoprotein
MMSADFDVIVVGSGPAGVSAAFPLVETGLKVMLTDGGQNIKLAPPSSSYLISRAEDEQQWEWMVGRDYHALQNVNAVSPKLRVPTHAHVFEGFDVANKIDANGFIAIGSLARGGLSNAWGCGVARLTTKEFSDFPFLPSEIEPSYETVTRRMGVSGALNDDLADYFGLDEWANPPILMDALQSRLFERYAKHRSTGATLAIKLGRSRVAVLEQDRGERKACDISGNCLWGCHRRALYSAIDDIELLKQYANFSYKSGFVVEQVVRAGEYRAVEGRDSSDYQTLKARKIILAAGTLATTRLALQAINLHKPVTMQACPTAAFMLWLPTALGTKRVSAFGLGQLSFTLPIQEGLSGFGSLFNTTGIPVAEFVRYMPFKKRYGIDVLKALLSSCVVGNLFLPGYL